MKIAYFDCMSGISGDMMLGALADAGVDLDIIQKGIHSLGLTQCMLRRSEVKKHGFRATQVVVESPPEHAHRHLHHINAMIDQGDISPSQKELAKRIFRKIGEAEAKVHGSTIEKIHFHEVGAVDSIADIVGCAIGLDLLKLDRVVCSPIPTGQGEIRIAHGLVSIPAPATAELLRGVPLRGSDVRCELATPTGAAIAVTVADEFGPLPSMRIEAIGYGAGQKDIPTQANVMRMIVGTAEPTGGNDQVWVLECNLDDISAEVIGFCTEKLFQAGALDVYTTPIYMKKNRPGTKITVLSDGAITGKMEKILFRETGTLGIRRWIACRHKLTREACEVPTELGPILGKIAYLDDGTVCFSPEFESCRKCADEKGIPLRQVYDLARRAFEEQGVKPSTGPGGSI